jgi:hypothetical protein
MRLHPVPAVPWPRRAQRTSTCTTLLVSVPAALVTVRVTGYVPGDV